MPVYNERIRVLQIGKYYYPFRGGMESSLYTLVNGLKGEVEFQVLVSNTKRVTEIEFIDGVRVIRAASWGSLFSQPLCPGIFFWLQKLKADIIHLHLPNPLAGFFYLLANPCSRLIISYHSDILRQKALNFLWRPLLLSLLRRADAVVVTSRNLLESSPALAGFSSKCHIIPHGIDLECFKSTPELESRSKEIKAKTNLSIVLFVGRLVYYKGLEYLIRAMKGIEAKLVIIGRGPLESKLLRLAVLCGVKDKIEWLGEIPSGELKAYYQACDLFVLPSCANSESFGLVILEAHSFAKPVVSTDLPTGVTFTNLHQKTGLVVSPKDSDSLKDTVNLLLASKELRDKYGEYARKRVGDEFTKEKMAEEIARVYESVVSMA